MLQTVEYLSPEDPARKAAVLDAGFNELGEVLPPTMGLLARPCEW